MACVVSDQQKNGQMLMHNFDKDISLLPQYNQQLKWKKRKRMGSKTQVNFWENAVTSHDYKKVTAAAKMFLLVGGEGVGGRVSPS